MSARTDLSGGYQATGIPTGIHLTVGAPEFYPGDWEASFSEGWLRLSRPRSAGLASPVDRAEI
jgi:hypothetical protein